MWLYLPWGAFSVIQHRGAKYLTVRCRVAADLDVLREKYLPELGATIKTDTADYPYRAHVNHVPFARALAKIVMEIDYPNVKAETAKNSIERERVYHRVHTATLGLETLERPPRASWMCSHYPEPPGTAYCAECESEQDPYDELYDEAFNGPMLPLWDN